MGTSVENRGSIKRVRLPPSPLRKPSPTDGALLQTTTVNASPFTTSGTVYLPAQGERPAEPAPYVMTGDDVMRLLQLDKGSERATYMTLRRARETGKLKATRVGAEVRYILPDVLRWLENQREDRTR